MDNVSDDRIERDLKIAQEALKRIERTLASNKPGSMFGRIPAFDSIESALRRFIDARVGHFARDIISATEAKETMVAEEHSDLLMTPLGKCTAVMIGRKMRDAGAIGVYLTGSTNQRGWVLRDHKRYERMSSGELFEEYKAQRTVF